jgi:hypothetical protein
MKRLGLDDLGAGRRKDATHASEKIEGLVDFSDGRYQLFWVRYDTSPIPWILADTDTKIDTDTQFFPFIKITFKTKTLMLKVIYSPYVNKAFVYIFVSKILSFIRQLFIFSSF